MSAGGGASGGPCEAGCQLGLIGCEGEAVPRLCELARDRQDFRVHLRTRATFGARDMYRRINACPHRSCNVGCGTATCALGRGMGGVVGSMDCEKCSDLPQ